MWRDFKYLLAYLAPLAAYWGIYQGGFWAAGSIYVGFLLIPVLEEILPKSYHNHSVSSEESRSRERFFDYLLYFNVPILWGLIFYLFYTLSYRSVSTGETIAMLANVGLVVGVLGINVGHELGHRRKQGEQFLAKLLLLSALYMHFFIEHNRGHHKNVATDEDPASAKLGEPIYTFWWRSVIGSYRNAWALEAKRLTKKGESWLSWSNQMLRFQVYQVVYLLGVGLVFGPLMVGYAIIIAILGFLLLESVNYIEHYGLRRKKLENGRYEAVSPRHSWNSDHELGRIFLYELTRHSDHHYKASRKYQILRRFDESPQLPHGYPASILLALVPPLWFRKMNERVHIASTFSRHA